MDRSGASTAVWCPRPREEHGQKWSIHCSVVSQSQGRAWTEVEHPLQCGVPVPGVDHKAQDRGAGRDMRQVVTVRSQGTDELLMQCTNRWSVGADDAVPRQVSIFRRQ